MPRKDNRNRRWAFYRVSIGMTRQEYESLTRPQLIALEQEITNARERDEFMHAQLCAMFFNANKARNTPAKRPFDFMLTRRAVEKAPTGVSGKTYFERLVKLGMAVKEPSK